MLFGRKKRRIIRLLIVEDEPLVAFDTEHALIEEGFQIVSTVDTVAAALTHLDARSRIDLVLTDVALADGSGVDVAHAAHRLGVPVMFVTGRAPDEIAGPAMGCLSKPYPQRDLLSAIAAIDAVLDGRKPGRLPASFRLFDPAR